LFYKEDKPVAFFPSWSFLDPLQKIPFLIPFVPDREDVVNQMLAATHRFGCKVPRGDGVQMKDFVRYAKAFIRKFFIPLAAEEIPTVRQWLDESNYSLRRKRYLLRIYEKATVLNAKIVRADAFIKNEGYDIPKAPRAINSPSDLSKVLLGPLMHAIDKKIFALKWFVKGSDPHMWPDRMWELFGNSRVFETDFKSMEAHHQGIYAEILHYWIMHMVRRCGLANCFKRLVSRMVRGTNESVFSKIKTSIPERLMSGAMWTSSANGVLNLLLMSYMTLRTRDRISAPEDLVCIVDQVKCLVEGDDGIMQDIGMDMSLIKKLGVMLTIDSRSNFSEAHFCGVICDQNERKVLYDPLKFVRNFFCFPVKYVNARDNKNWCLARAKALSYLYNFSSSPVVGPFCHHMCELTRGYDVVSVLSEIDSFKVPYVLSALRQKIWKQAPVISSTSREIVALRFGVSVSRQQELESILCAQSGPFFVELRDFMKDIDYQHSFDDVAFEGRHVSQNFHGLSMLPCNVRNSIEKACHRKRQVLRADKSFDWVVPRIAWDLSAHGI
jgi:hypothetical protein